ncbi:Rpn family recombination-promoting nuclease/putative transposase [Ruania alba]|uniref:Uncharacterized protein n=1 Tax=Ruania alba TaxID=648782 RepID=A0A1H5H1D0_9MICO|nr:Rpn family recombination-promoting nuclease/putative transposase [Ruania alba]SEE21786.1 conserved hypothetical protein (putative transposase or invertase) [Ruania alba]
MARRNETPNPHDAMFRAVVGVPANAASVLASALPAKITGGLDLDGLRLEPGSFVDEEMRQRHTDLLFSTRLNRDPTLVYVLVEHQSSPDPLMALRVLEYVTRIWWRHLDAGDESDDPHKPRPRPGATARTLPPVLPVVVYQGRRRWNTPTAMDGLYDDASEQALGSFLPRHQFVLQDLTGVEVEELLAAPLTPAARLALAMLRFAPRQEHLAQVLERFTPDVLDLVRTRADQMFTIIMEYAYQVSDTPPAQVRHYFEDLGPDAQEAYMSNTLERGRAEGVAEGVAKGVAKGVAGTLTRLLVRRFGPLTSEQTARIESATPDQLDAWVDRVIDATSIDDVLR